MSTDAGDVAMIKTFYGLEFDLGLPIFLPLTISALQ